MMAAHEQRHSYTLSALLAGIAEVAAEADRPVSGLALDSRRVGPGQAFVALAGTRTHGLDHADTAIAAGAVAVLWEAEGRAAPLALSWRTGPGGHKVPLLAIPELSQLVGVIADRFYGQPSHRLFTVGVTGTNGKTSVTQFLAQILSADAPCGVIGTLGNGLYGQLSETRHTTPDAITTHALLSDMCDRGASAAVLEVSSHGLEQGRVNGVAFDTAVFTNLSHEHLDYHGDMDAYGRAKRRLFEMPGLRTAVVNADDAFGRELLTRLSADVQVLSYGLEVHGEAPTLYGTELRLDLEGLRLQVHSPWGEGELVSSLLGRFNAANLLAVLGVLLAHGMALDTALARLAGLTTVPGRMERFGGGERPLLVVDYAHTPDALEQVLAALREHTAGSLWCVFGCGGERDRAKRPFMGRAAERLADFVVLTDDNPRGENPWDIVSHIQAGMQRPDAAYVERDRAAAIERAFALAGPGDVVLIAGKGHEDYQEVAGERRSFSDVEQVRRLLGEAGR